MESNQRLKILSIVLGSLAVLFALGLLRDYAFQPDVPPRFLRCPECDHEEVYDKIKEGKPCPRCNKQELRPVAKSLQEAAQEDDTIPIYERPFAIGLFVLTLALAGINTYVFLLRKPETEVKPKKKTYLQCKCHQCRKMIRYEPQPVEQKILCESCRYEVTVPAVRTNKVSSRP
jgi:hypothetical protein